MSRTLYLVSITVLTLSFVKFWQIIGQNYVLPMIEVSKDGERYTPSPQTENSLQRYTRLEFKDLLNENSSVTFKTAEHNPNIVHAHAQSPVISAEDVLRDTWGRSTWIEERDEKTGDLVQSMMECKGTPNCARLVLAWSKRLDFALDVRSVGWKHGFDAGSVVLLARRRGFMSGNLPAALKRKASISSGGPVVAPPCMVSSDG